MNIEYPSKPVVSSNELRSGQTGIIRAHPAYDGTIVMKCAKDVTSVELIVIGHVNPDIIPCYGDSFARAHSVEPQQFKLVAEN